MKRKIRIASRISEAQRVEGGSGEKSTWIERHRRWGGRIQGSYNPLPLCAASIVVSMGTFHIYTRAAGPRRSGATSPLDWRWGEVGEVAKRGLTHEVVAFKRILRAQSQKCGFC